MVATRWVELVAAEASASGSSDVGLESSAIASETESEARVLASMAGSSGVA
jgi:alkanesulfonate monooxygenase SsuD/methylene tetrahydromethanopterin reductase-like flavin-dependent oxidoreductase (luciferase family)